MIVFIVVAGLMLAVALWLVLSPLLRGASADDPTLDAKRKLKLLDQARDEGLIDEAGYAEKRAQLGRLVLDAIDRPAPRGRGTMIIALAVALLLPATAIVTYRTIGDPRALDGVATAAQSPADHGQDMDAAIGKLADKLKQNPDDAQGWALLGRAYEATEHFAQARDALKHARDLAPDDADVTVAYAEALALSGDSRLIEGEPLALIDQVLKGNPNHERALWLRGIADYQAKKYDSAIQTWQHLIGVLPKDSDVAKSVQQEIARAEAARDGREIPDEEASVAATPAENTGQAAPSNETPGGASLVVKVTLSPKLKDKLGAKDALYVFAKAANGPPMPLAIARTTADKLPLTVTLTDGMGMIPSMKLSQFPQVIVGARVSKSGNAIAQSGDLQTLSSPVPVTRTEPVELTIDQVVP